MDAAQRKSAQRKLAAGANPIAGMGAISARAAAKARAKYPSAASLGAAIPAHREVAPAPANPAPTGTEHLSSVQFGGKPAGQSSSMIPGAMGMSHGSVKRTTPMHPGGAGMGGPRFVVSPPKVQSNPNYLAGSGNTVASGKASPNVSAPKSVSSPAQSAGAAYWAGLGMGGSPAQPKARGNPQPLAAPKSKSAGMRSAVKQKVGGKVKGFRFALPHKSRHEGANAKNLKAATGAAG